MKQEFFKITCLKHDQIRCLCSIDTTSQRDMKNVLGNHEITLIRLLDTYRARISKSGNSAFSGPFLEYSIFISVALLCPQDAIDRQILLQFCGI